MFIFFESTFLVFLVCYQFLKLFSKTDQVFTFTCRIQNTHTHRAVVWCFQGALRGSSTTSTAKLWPAMYRRLRKNNPGMPVLSSSLLLDVCVLQIFTYILIFKATKNLTDFPFLFCTPWQGQTRIERWASITHASSLDNFWMVHSDRWQYQNINILLETSPSYYNVGLSYSGVEPTPLFPSTCFSLGRKTRPRRQPKYMQKGI